MPIVRKDTDIINLQSRQYQDVNNVLDIFVKAQTSVHILRAIEPSLKYGINLERFLENFSTDNPLPKCQYMNTSLDWKCINLASRKQLGEAAMVLENSITGSS